jgi:GntR family transcriptional regulator
MFIERPQPLTQQVNAILRQRIRAGIYAPGSRLPAESELATELSVSRATIRTVMATLATEGVVLRKQGDGTYVNEQVDAINTNDGGILDFSRLIKNSGYRAKIKPVSTETRQASTREAQILMINENEELFSLERLFLVNNQPAISAINLIPANLFTKSTELLDGSLTLQEILEQYCRQIIAFGTYEIEPIFASPPVSTQLKLPPQTPLLFLTVTFFNQDNQPIVLGKSYFNHKILPLRFMQAWT